VSSAGVVPLLVGLFAILVIGAALKRQGRLDRRGVDLLNGLILDVTMPALILTILQRSHLGAGVGRALLAATIAMGASMALAVVVSRALGLSRQAQGAAGMVTAFSNTGFLGLPVVQAVFGRESPAASAAVVIDAVDTTFLLWTVGVSFAQRMGDGARFDARGALALFKRPLMIALAVGLALQLLSIELPGPALRALDTLGAATTPLVFLSLGATLDLGAVRGRLVPLFSIAALKLVVMPAVALAVVLALRALQLDAAGGGSLAGVFALGAIDQVAVLQCAMPSALVSVILASRHGCDAHFAAGAAVLATLGAIFTLPLVVELLHRAAALGAAG